jgi:hypothetical protein
MKGTGGIPSQRSSVGRLSSYFPGAVDDDVEARDFASGGPSRIFAHHVEERLLVRIDRDLDHDKALDMRRRAAVQDTEDQGTVDALGLIGLKRWINGYYYDPSTIWAFLIGNRYLLG